MARRKKKPPAEVPPVQTTALYRMDQLSAALGISRQTLSAEVSAGRLSAYKVCGRLLVSGAAILAWVERIHERRPPTPRVARKRDEAKDPL